MTTEERLRSLLEAATPGPWIVQEPGLNDLAARVWPRYIDTHAYPDGPEPVVAATYPLADFDAALIVEAVNALPKLLAVVAASRPVSACLEGLREGEAGEIDRLTAALATLDEP